MDELNKPLIFLSILFVINLFVFTACSGLNWTDEVLLSDCVNSVGSDIVEYSAEIRNFVRSDGNWYVLSDNEAKAVLSKLPTQKCSSLQPSPSDLKENRLNIAVRKTTFIEGFEIVVWSKGFDNTSGTEDDIVFPSGEKVPV